MKTREIHPARRVRGETSLPGDKSLAHRFALVASVADGVSRADNFPVGADCASTLRCLEGLGVPIIRRNGTIEIEGRGFGGLVAPNRDLDAGNSGTTVRLLSGILVGQSFSSTLVGDASLGSRPMGRIIEPLRRFGADIQADDDSHLPLRIRGGRLRAIEYRLPMASAQVKSAILLAGLQAQGTTVVTEPTRTRDHTEIALRESGARIRVSDGRIEIDGGVPIRSRSVSIPGDVSSAAFLIAAALAIPNSELRLTGLGVNPTRTGCLSLLERVGARIVLDKLRNDGGEPVANILARSSTLSMMKVHPSSIPTLIDEVPILAVLGTRATGGFEIRGAGELRLKESDRIEAVVKNLRAIGVRVEEFFDGLRIPGDQKIEGGTVSSFGDHRIAMAFAIAGLLSKSGVTIEDVGCVDISFPGFFELLDRLVEH
jgi:3-phosphoshikimate 1-carboxyvinyltransferase